MDLFSITDFKTGQRVKIHPASDWFMRGITWAEVVKVGRTRITVRAPEFVGATGSQPQFTLLPRNVTEIL
jgi:hypothetical protein